MEPLDGLTDIPFTLEQRRYVSEKLHPIFTGIFKDCLEKKPDDVKQFMIEWLSSNKSSGNGNSDVRMPSQDSNLLRQLQAELNALKEKSAIQEKYILDVREQVRGLGRDAALSFSVCQYNILAGYLGHNTQPWLLYGIDISDEVRDAITKKFYQKGADGKFCNAGWPNYVVGILSDEQIKVVEELENRVFAWDKRRAKILEVMDANDADVYSVVELDDFEGFENHLKGYGGKFEKRPRRSSHDGCGIFWRELKFSLVDSLSFAFVDGVDAKGVEIKDRAALLVLLSFKRCPRERIIVISTHLARNPEDSAMTFLRARQIAQLMKNLTEFAAKNDALDCPVVMMGDLNAAVFGEIRGMARAVFQLAGQDVHSFLWRSDDVQTTATSVTSTRDVRIDAVMYQPTHLKVLEVYVPEVKEKIPNDMHPSDHVPVYVSFQVKADHKRRRESAHAWLAAITHSNQKIPVLLPSEMARAFEYFDREHTFKIDEFDIEESCNNLGIDLSTQQQAILLKCFDNSRINWEDFVLSFNLQLTPDRMTGVADLEKCFDILSSGKGAMKLDNLKTAFTEISPVKYTDEEMRDILSVIQTDADGFIDQQLFTTAVLKGYAAGGRDSQETAESSDSDEESSEDEADRRILHEASSQAPVGRMTRKTVQALKGNSEDPIQHARLLRQHLQRFQAFLKG
jgi:Ca2+-binding EF-hand superfamily protein/exonuclease III